MVKVIVQTRMETETRKSQRGLLSTAKWASNLKLWPSPPRKMIWTHLMKMWKAEWNRRTRMWSRMCISIYAICSWKLAITETVWSTEMHFWANLRENWRKRLTLRRCSTWPRPVVCLAITSLPWIRSKKPLKLLIVSSTKFPWLSSPSQSNSLWVSSCL